MRSRSNYFFTTWSLWSVNSGMWISVGGERPALPVRALREAAATTAGILRARVGQKHWHEGKLSSNSIQIGSFERALGSKRGLRFVWIAIYQSGNYSICYQKCSPILRIFKYNSYDLKFENVDFFFRAPKLFFRRKKKYPSQKKGTLMLTIVLNHSVLSRMSPEVIA